MVCLVSESKALYPNQSTTKGPVSTHSGKIMMETTARVHYSSSPHLAVLQGKALAVTPEERDLSSVSVEEFLQEQAEDPFCRAAAEIFWNPDCR